MRILQDHGTDYDTYGKTQYPDSNPVPVPVILERIYHRITIMDEHSTLAVGLKNLMAVERTATNYGIMYAGPGDRHDPGTHPLHVRAETADRRYDPWRSEGIRRK